MADDIKWIITGSTVWIIWNQLDIINKKYFIVIPSAIGTKQIYMKWVILLHG